MSRCGSEFDASRPYGPHEGNAASVGARSPHAPLCLRTCDGVRRGPCCASSDVKVIPRALRTPKGRARTQALTRGAGSCFLLTMHFGHCVQRTPSAPFAERCAGGMAPSR